MSRSSPSVRNSDGENPPPVPVRSGSVRLTNSTLSEWPGSKSGSLGRSVTPIQPEQVSFSDRPLPPAPSEKGPSALKKVISFFIPNLNRSGIKDDDFRPEISSPRGFGTGFRFIIGTEIAIDKNSLMFCDLSLPIMSKKFLWSSGGHKMTF